MDATYAVDLLSDSTYLGAQRSSAGLPISAIFDGELAPEVAPARFSEVSRSSRGPRAFYALLRKNAAAAAMNVRHNLASARTRLLYCHATYLVRHQRDRIG